MLYLLPPAPPPIISTLIPQQVTGISAKKTATKLTKASIQNHTSTTENLVCIKTTHKVVSTDLVGKLLGKMLANSKTEKQIDHCTLKNKKSAILSFPSQIHKQKPAKGFVPSQKIANTEITTATAPSVDTHSTEQPQQQATNSIYQIDEQNAVGKILQTVQELISVSLYASIDNSITDVVQPNPETVATGTTNQDNQAAGDTDNQVAARSIGTAKIIEVVQELISLSLYASTNNPDDSDTNTETEIASSTPQQTSTPEVDNSQKVAATSTPANSTPEPTDTALELARVPGEPFLVGVMINGREIGTIDIIQEDNTLLIPLENFGDLTGYSIVDNRVTQLKTPLGLVELPANSTKQINGVTYISKTILQQILKINIELNTADLTLLVDLPWRGGDGRYRTRAAQLKPEFFAPRNGLSNYRQELNAISSGGETTFRSSTLLGGRLLGGAWRLRFENDFVDRPDVSEYFFYKRSGRFRYQLGRQQIGLHPLLNGLDLTGLQFGYSNLPEDSFSSSYSANELLPRRSRPIQSFVGQAPPASFVQLRVSGVIVAQQQVGFNGQYEFIDVNLPVGQSNEIEVLIYDRNNLRIPSEIRSVRINASDLLLPAGGNVQLGGLGFSGNLVQNSLFESFDSDYNNKPVGFYQLRQGLSNNLTFEGSVQAVPNSIQSQAGLIWRLANPLIISASVGNSDDKVGYIADVDFNLNRLEINANSQSLPERFRSSSESKSRYNHSLELRYRFSNNLNLGFLARNRQDAGSSAAYILPTFSFRPFSTVSMSGRPDIDGRYLLNAFYQPNDLTRLSFNSYGDSYISDLTYNVSRNYQLSFGSELGGNLAPRYSLGFGRNPNGLDQLSWNVGLAFRDGDVGPIAGASMQVLPGLFGRIEYQGIPSRTRGNFGGFGDDRLSLTLVSDLSFARGRVAPASYTGISKERGAIAGRLVVKGEAGFDLAGSNVRVYNNRNQNVGGTRTDNQGNFFVGNLPEGNYVVELEPDELPVELSVPKTSLVVQVANSAVTKLDFPVTQEYGVAGRITDVSGQPIERVRVELVTTAGVRAMSAMSDQFGLYRMDGVPVGKYILRVSPQDALNPNDALPKRQIDVRNDFVYNQNLELPISTAVKKK
jgi:hypothetical protein